MRLQPLTYYSRLTLLLVSFLLPFPVIASCIAVVTAGGGDGFWGDVKQGAEAAAKELSIKVIVRGAADEVDSDAQAKIINSMMALGCRALVLAPNSQARNKDVIALKAKGISTVFIDRDIGGERVSVIKTDNFQAGYLAGMEMAKALNKSFYKRVILLRMDKHVVSTRLREEGFIKAAKEQNLELIFDDYLGTTISQARINAVRFLKQVGKFEGVFTPNESTSVSVLASLKQLGIAKNVKHIGFDSHAMMIKSVQQKNMYGFIVQNPFLIGYQGIKTAYAAMSGQAYPAVINTDVVFVNGDNITHKDIQTLLGFLR